MSEGTHSTVAPANAAKRPRLLMLAAGTTVALLLTGVALQVFRAEDGVAAQEPAAGTAARTSPGQRPLARVGSELITWDAVAQECMARHGRDVLDNIINRAIIQQECKRQGIEITKAEVDAEINRIAKRFGLAPDQWYAMLQAERNLTPDQYQRDVVWPMLALKKLAGEKVDITPRDIDQAYVRDYGPRVEARMIMFDNQRRATDVHEKLRQKPEDFERLAQEHSIEPNSRALGGKVPPIRRYAGSTNLEEAAFKLQPGELSPVIAVGVPDGPQRFVILQCEGQTKPVATLEEVRETVVADLQEEKVQLAVAKVFEDIKKRTRVDNYLTKMVSGGVEQTSATAPAGAVRPAAAPGQPAPSTATQGTARVRN